MGCCLFQVAGQQHGGGQGGEGSRFAPQNARAQAYRDRARSLGGFGFLDREAALAARDDRRFFSR